MKSILFIIVLFFLSNLFGQTLPVYVVLFTHIEDNTPTGTLGIQQSKDHYTLIRNKMIGMAKLAQKYNVTWVFQPDWKILEAALLYEDASMKSNSNGKNFLRYIKEDLKTIIDPHSHENGGYNYTDVAYLLDSLGVGATTVIGGHIWDPSLPQFQKWDRFRVPVKGLKYPKAGWRGDILMGSGTPNHVNDPTISGVWRPKDRNNYFVDDSAGNISAVGQYKSDIAGISELISLYENKIISSDKMLTASYHIKPLDITGSGGVDVIEKDIIKPLADLHIKGKIKLTDFTSLINDWKTVFGAKAYLYNPNIDTDVNDRITIPQNFLLFQNYPNPFNPSTTIRYKIPVVDALSGAEVHVTLKVYDVLGREIATLVNEFQQSGIYNSKLRIDNARLASNTRRGELSSGVYFYRLTAGKFSSVKKMLLIR